MQIVREEAWPGAKGGRLQHTIQRWSDFRAHWFVYTDPAGRMTVLDSFGGEAAQLCSDVVCSGSVLAWVSRHTYDDDADFQLNLFDLRRERYFTTPRAMQTFDELLHVHAGPRTVTATGRKDGKVVHVSHPLRGFAQYSPVVVTLNPQNSPHCAASAP